MKLSLRVACLLLALASLAALVRPLDAKVVYTKRSLYRNLSVTEEGDQLCLRFAGVRAELAQSCIEKRDPAKLVFAYTQMVFAGLLVQPEPRRVLVAGLGGGSIPRVLHELVPQAQIDVVEIDPAVRDVAAEYFGFRAGDNVDVIIRDARVFVKHALRKRQRYDFIVLDAFNGDYIPEHLMTLEFLEECEALLAPGGVLVANTFSQSRLYDSESVTYERAFGWFLTLRRAASNRIIVTRKGPPLSAGDLRRLAEQRVGPAAKDPAVAQAEAQRFERYGIDLLRIAHLARDRADWDPRARVLTDQYSPANLLNQGR